MSKAKREVIAAARDAEPEAVYTCNCGKRLLTVQSRASGEWYRTPFGCICAVSADSRLDVADHFMRRSAPLTARLIEMQAREMGSR